MDTPVANQIAKLAKMGLPELREEYEQVFGKPTKSRNRKQLFAQIAKKLQNGDDADVSVTDGKPTLTAKFEPKRQAKKTGKAKDQKKQHKPIGARDPRLPKVGTTIERVYKGNKHLVRVLEKGFEYDGKPYRSLSALAQAITGAKAINGYFFFQLGDYAKSASRGVKEKTGK